MAAWVVHGVLDGGVRSTGYLTGARANPPPSPLVFGCLAKVGSAPAAIIATATSTNVKNNIMRLISATTRKERGD